MAAASTAGTLHVAISHATNLRAADNDGLSDPYIKVTTGGRTEKTPVVDIEPRDIACAVSALRSILREPRTRHAAWSAHDTPS